jgi:uncharacterized protein with HEPN domain
VTKRQQEDYLQDILDAVSAIEQFTAGIELEVFSQNLEKVLPFQEGLRLLAKRLSGYLIQ